MFLSRIWIDSGGSIICDVVVWVCLLSITRLPSLTARDMKLNPSVSRHALLHDCVKASAISGNLSSRLFPYIRTRPPLSSKKVPESGGGLSARGSCNGQGPSAVVPIENPIRASSASNASLATSSTATRTGAGGGAAASMTKQLVRELGGCRIAGLPPAQSIHRSDLPCSRE